MLQEIRILLVEAEEAIQKLVSVKVRIAAELACQVAEAPGKTIGAKKWKVLSGLGQEERKAITDLDQFYWEKIFDKPKNPKKKEEGPRTRRGSRGTQRQGPRSENKARQSDGPRANPRANKR